MAISEKGSSAPPRIGISIIVPVFNEVQILRGFLLHLRETAPEAEIIVVDGGSTDGTRLAIEGLADRTVDAPQGRWLQMNRGAEAANGNVFWFLHADSHLLPNPTHAIEEVLADIRVVGGSFSLRITPGRLIYRARDFVGNLCVRVGGVALGDRGIFCRREAFFAIGGYREMPIFEEADLYRRLEKIGLLGYANSTIETSARRYEKLGPLKTILFYTFLVILFSLGIRVSTLHRFFLRFTESAPAKSNLRKHLAYPARRLP